MKKSSITLAFLLLSIHFFAQQTKLEIEPKSIFVPADGVQKPTFDIGQVLQGVLSCSVIGAPVQVLDSNVPFKIYTIENNNWALQQDMYNSVASTVPGLQITQNNPVQIPNFSIRGADDPIFIVDGIQVDAALILNLNPADIQSVKVSNNPAAELCLRFR